MPPAKRRKLNPVRSFDGFKEQYEDEYKKYIYFAVGLNLDTPILESFLGCSVFFSETAQQNAFAQEMRLFAAKCGYKQCGNTWRDGKQSLEIVRDEDQLIFTMKRDTFLWMPPFNCMVTTWDWERKKYRKQTCTLTRFKAIVGKKLHYLGNTAFWDRV